MHCGRIIYKLLSKILKFMVVLTRNNDLTEYCPLQSKHGITDRLFSDWKTKPYSNFKLSFCNRPWHIPIVFYKKPVYKKLEAGAP